MLQGCLTSNEWVDAEWWLLFFFCRFFSAIGDCRSRLQILYLCSCKCCSTTLRILTWIRISMSTGCFLEYKAQSKLTRVLIFAERRPQAFHLCFALSRHERNGGGLSFAKFITVMDLWFDMIKILHDIQITHFNRRKIFPFEIFFPVIKMKIIKDN